MMLNSKAILSVILVSTLFSSGLLIPSFAQTTVNGVTITVVTDKTSYNEGDIITIYGTVSKQLDAPISIVIRDPSQMIVLLSQANSNPDGTYSAKITAGGDLWKSSGTYEVDVTYKEKDTISTTTFQFTGSTGETGQISSTTQSSLSTNQYVTANEIDMTKGAGSSATAYCVAAKNCFSPNPLSVAQGTTVTWKNTDTVSHYVTSGNPADNATGTVFDSGNLIKPEGTYQFTFTNAGIYDYYCSVHPWMTGQVIVGGEQSAPPSRNTITVSTDKPSYTYGDSIEISGQVEIVRAGTPVTIQISDSSGHLVLVAETDVIADGTYHDSISSQGNLWKDNGIYTVKVQYGLQNLQSQTTFNFIASSSFTPPPISSGGDIAMTQGAGANANTYCVAAKNCFSPSVFSAHEGQTVTWYNADTVSHYVTSGNPSDNTTGTVFDSDNLIKPRETYQFTFSNAGTFNYFCSVHPWMIGQVIVGSGVQSTSTSAFSASQQDIENISQAKASQTIAGEVNVGNDKTETTSIDNNVSIQTTNFTPDSLDAKVSAPDQTGPKVIMFNLAATTINVANLKDLGVMYDGKAISPAPNMDAILHAKSTDNPSFAIVVTQSGVQVLVLVPHFSTHTITLTNMSKVISVVPEFPISLVVLLVAIALTITFYRIKPTIYK